MERHLCNVHVVNALWAAQLLFLINFIFYVCFTFIVFLQIYMRFLLPIFIYFPGDSAAYGISMKKYSIAKSDEWVGGRREYELGEWSFQYVNERVYVWVSVWARRRVCKFLPTILTLHFTEIERIHFYLMLNSLMATVTWMMISWDSAAVNELVRFCYLLKSVGVDRLRFLFCSAATAAFTTWLFPINTVVPSLFVLLLPLGCCCNGQNKNPSFLSTFITKTCDKWAPGLSSLPVAESMNYCSIWYFVAAAVGFALVFVNVIAPLIPSNYCYWWRQPYLYRSDSMPLLITRKKISISLWWFVWFFYWIASFNM